MVDDGWRGVCSCCITDPALALYVDRRADIEQCSFCSRAATNGLTLDELFRYMCDSLEAEWDDPVEDVGWDGREGGWQIAEGTILDSYDLLAHLDDPLGDGPLRNEFVKAFDHEWCPHNPYRLSDHEVLADSWDAFSRYVREERRYLFLHASRRAQDSDSELIEPSQFLDNLQVALRNSGLIRRLPRDHRLFRARDHKPHEPVSTSADLGSPPHRRSRSNRMSPPGISMFYAAEDLETALAELRPEEPHRLAAVGAWSTAREMAYLDLVDIVVPSIFDMTASYKRPWLRFLKRFAGEVSRPIDPDAAAIDYVPTQIITEYIRHVMVADDGAPVRGIRYRSATGTGGISWVIFVDAAGCGDLKDGWQNAEDLWLGLDVDSIHRCQPGWRPSP